MKVLTISATYGGTIPTGSYANERVEFSVTAELSPDELLHPTLQDLGVMLKDLFDEAKREARNPQS